MVSKAAILGCLLAAASPAASQTTPREIAEIADLSGLAVSPDGNWIAYRVERPSTVTNRIDIDWYLAPTDATAPPRALGRLGTAMWNDAGSVLPGEATWMPDGKAVVVRALVDGRIGLWVRPTRPPRRKRLLFRLQRRACCRSAHSRAVLPRPRSS